MESESLPWSLLVWPSEETKTRHFIMAQKQTQHKEQETETTLYLLLWFVEESFGHERGVKWFPERETEISLDFVEEASRGSTDEQRSTSISSRWARDTETLSSLWLSHRGDPERRGGPIRRSKQMIRRSKQPIRRSRSGREERLISPREKKKRRSRQERETREIVFGGREGKGSRGVGRERHVFTRFGASAPK